MIKSHLLYQLSYRGVACSDVWNRLLDWYKRLGKPLRRWRRGGNYRDQLRAVQRPPYGLEDFRHERLLRFDCAHLRQLERLQEL